MRNILLLLFLSATFFAASECAESSTVEIPLPHYDNVTTTPAPITPNTTTSAPTPPAPPPKTTTTAPPTPGPAPKTTTIAPPTPPPAPTTTTVAPPTTPLPPQPTPVDPQRGTWQILDKTNASCLILQLALQVEIPYVAQNQSRKGVIDLPPNATVVGDCGSVNVALTWNTTVPPTGNATNVTVLTNSVEFVFGKEKNETMYAVTEVVLKVVPESKAFPGFQNDSQIITFYHKRPEFVTTLKKSYKCMKLQTFNLTSAENSNDTVAFLHVSSVHLQAFANTTKDQFLEAEMCEGPETPDIVPIAVGCALVALIIIVLIAYLIGRRRSQARGYLSM